MEKSNHIEIKCTKCNNLLLKDIHDSEENEYLEYCISIHENDEIFYYCGYCEYYYLLCPVCYKDGKQSLCQFIKHCGYKWNTNTMSDEQYSRINGIETLLTDSIGIPCYDVSDLNLYYFDTSPWIPTGPNGGSYHEWRCNVCKKEYSTTDK